MKLNNKDSPKEMSSQQQQIKREKSMDSKDKLKQDKLQKQEEKKEKERMEKERKERDKREKERLEKERKEREKKNKKSGSGSASNVITNAATSSNLNRLDSSNSNQDTGMTNSKSENVLSLLRKQTSKLSETKAKPKQPVIESPLDQQQPLLPKGRFRCQVIYLDESVKTFDMDKNAIGDDLLTNVCRDLELVEKEYFSLTYRDYNNMKFWLDHDKKIKTQLKGIINTVEPVFNFEVKFYPPEPKFLQEEITRYLLTLQLRHDIMDGKLPCTFVTHALLGSFTVQAELGDHDEINNANDRVNGFTGFDYLEGFCFAPNQTTELLAAIADCHKDHKGQSPAEAEMHYLENAVKLAMYGVDLHNAKDSDGVDILIGVSASGLLVFRDHLRINRFAWPKILKISYKRNHFYLKLRPSEFEKYETTIGFRCPNHKAAKRLWKIAVEHHAFFRLREPEAPKKSRILLPNFNSNFRYTGSSTYMQSRNRSIDRSQPSFKRSLSKRLTQSMDRGLATQNPSETPGSVQSAAFNHFNRIKQNQSTSNITRQNIDLRESQEDLDLGGDYDVNDQNNFENNDFPNEQQDPYKKHQIREPGSNRNNYVNNPNNSSRVGGKSDGLPRLNQGFNDQYSLNTGTKKSSTLPNFGQQDEQLDEYYTSVDRNLPLDPNRNPSMISNNSQKVSTPILNPSNQDNKSSSNRYVPSRPIQPVQLPVSPRSNFANSQNYSQEHLNKPKNPSLPQYDEHERPKQESEPVPFKSAMYQPGQDRLPSNRTASDRSNNLPLKPSQQSSTTSSFRPTEQFSDRIQTSTPSSSQPQPTIRGSNRQPPPVPADRSVNNSNRSGQERYQQQQFLEEQELENQRIILQQRELELQQEMQRLQRQKQQQHQQQSSLRQPSGSSQTSFQNPSRTIESSRSGSHTSTPDASRVKKQIVVNENVNHKDLLLKAIQMATELDPNLEVEKVEISTED